MAVADQSGGSSQASVDGDNNQIFSESSVPGLRLKEIYSSVDEHPPKVRKPYTITKQRERWTDEEHKKFLEALKLHGRAWRKIEEHIGTKTAVQIRSHAQKFFSKVVRESSDINGSSIKPTEIPPPRPKRKPMHPYPRKLVRSFKKGISVLDQSEMSTSPKFSVRDNQSPTSVLSAVGSDTSRSTASNPKSRSPSPVSSGVGGNSERENGFMIFSSSAYEENGVSTSIPISSTSIPEEKSPEKLDLGSQGNYTKEGVDVEESTISLKLFGKTVLVTNSHRPNSPPGTHKPAPPESLREDFYMNNENNAQRPTWNSLQVEVFMSATNSVWNPSPGQSPAFYYMPLTKEDLNPVNVAAPVPLPWWPSYGSLPFPLHRSPNQAFGEMPAQSWPEEAMENEIKKERSLTGSNAASVCKVGNFNRNCNDVGSENLETPSNGDLELVFQLKQSDTSAFSVRTTNSSKFVKGFVPYKRCLAQRETHSSSAPIGEEREGQRIRLCL